MDSTRIHIHVPLILMGIAAAGIIWFGLGYVCGMHTSGATTSSTVTLTVGW